MTKASHIFTNGNFVDSHGWRAFGGMVLAWMKEKPWLRVVSEWINGLFKNMPKPKPKPKSKPSQAKPKLYGSSVGRVQHPRKLLALWPRQEHAQAPSGGSRKFFQGVQHSLQNLNITSLKKKKITWNFIKFFYKSLNITTSLKKKKNTWNFIKSSYESS